MKNTNTHPSSPETATGLPAVSVIITTHNDEETVVNTVNSITEQSMSDVEILILDDCSTDTTWHKVEKLTGEDNRINPLRSSYNLGPSAMRNIGMDHACGEYVCFVDGDDTMNSDGLAQLLERACSVSSDVVRGSHVLTVGGNANQNIPEHFHQPEVLRTCYADMPSLVQLYTSWNMLIRRKLLCKTGIQFDVGMRLGEDRIFNQKIFNSATSISLMKFESYNWIRKQGAQNHLSAGTNVADRITSISNFLDTMSVLQNATPVHCKMVHASMAFELAMCMRKCDREGVNYDRAISNIWGKLCLDRRWITNPAIKGYSETLLNDLILNRMI